VSLLLYNILITLLWPFYRTLILYSGKIAAFHDSRVLSLRDLDKFLITIKERGKPLWLHASSVGEFDQALGILRAVKKHHKQQIVIISVFSMSVKTLSHPEADFIFRLPLDFYFIWPAIIKKINPDAFVTMTWDIFPNLMHHLNKNNIPAFLCSAALNKTSSRLRFPLLQLYRPVYEKFQGIGAADENNRTLLSILYRDENHLKITGDSRYDTILYKIKNSKLKAEDTKMFSGLKNNVLVLASTYNADDQAILPRLDSLLQKRSDWTVLIFPHHVDRTRLQEVEKNTSQHNLKTVRYSKISSFKNNKIIVVDKLGLLALSYRHATLAYVGGAFHHRIHNTAEPAAFGIPVLTGPKIESSPAALALQNAGALISCDTGKDLISEMADLMDEEKRRDKMGGSGKQLVKNQSGSSELFYKEFLKNVLNS